MKSLPAWAISLATLLINAAVTYGVITTNMEWMKMTMRDQQSKIDRIENYLFYNAPRKPASDKAL